MAIFGGHARKKSLTSPDPPSTRLKPLFPSFPLFSFLRKPRIVVDFRAFSGTGNRSFSVPVFGFSVLDGGICIHRSRAFSSLFRHQKSPELRGRSARLNGTIFSLYSVFSSVPSGQSRINEVVISRINGCGRGHSIFCPAKI